jgi:hypothetical protein
MWWKPWKPSPNGELPPGIGAETDVLVVLRGDYPVPADPDWTNAGTWAWGVMEDMQDSEIIRFATKALIK